LMFFPYASPKMFMGVDQLQTDLGTKVILGDGGLFAREPQNITNSDMANEYASCESARSVINTPMGIFFISQAQGKIFQYSGKLVAISDKGMKWWFNKYLPSVLLRQFPELEGTELDDNPVVGIGCQAIYDINDDIVYFTKKDYSVKEEYVGQIIFDPFLCQFEFQYSGTRFPVKLEDETYFDNASWTVSYDPKIRGWISFHDWHPEFVLPSINHFLTTKTFASDIPLCPPGYSLVNGVCQKTLNETTPGFVDIDEVPANINYDVNPIECDCPPGYTLVFPEVLPNNQVIWTQPTGDCETNILTNTGGPGNGTPVIEEQSLECPIDLVFVVQADDSTSVDDLHNPDQQIILTNYIQQFLLNGDIANAINNQNMQVGVVMHAKNGVGNCFVFGGGIDYSLGTNDRLNFAFPSGQRFMQSNDPSTNTDNVAIANGIFSWLNNNWIGNRGILTTWGTDYGQRFGINEVINRRFSPESQLGNRDADPNYRAIVFHVTGLVNIWNIGPPVCYTTANIAQQNLSPLQTPGGQGPSWMYSLAAYIPYEYDIITGAYNPTPGTVVGPLSSDSFTINDITQSLDFSSDIINVVNKIKEICNNPTSTVDVCDCYDYDLTILDTAPLDQYDILYQECVTGSYETQVVQKGQTVTISCVRENSVSFVQNIGAGFFTLIQGVLCDTQYNCDSGPTSEPSIASVPAICRKIDCGCPPSSLPNATLTQTGDCDSISNLVYLVGDPSYIIPPDLISCDYEALLQVEPSLERGTLWRHNYRCDLYANYYGQDYPWEIELVENTGQMVTTIRSFEYQMEAYVYNGDLHNGCGDDRWHDLDFNFDKAIIYNSEQVSGLLTLVPHPKEDPLNMIIYPIIGAQDIQILYSKEEQKYRFNQFWDITRDRAEFTNPTTTPPFFPTYQYQPGVTPLDSPGQNIFITELNGYIKDLNFNNLLYQKSSDQRKKFRHYFNKVILRRTLSGNRKMLLKLNNTKLNLSIR